MFGETKRILYFEQVEFRNRTKFMKPESLCASHLSGP